MKENIKIRKIFPSDLKKAKKFLNFINSLIEEDAMILFNKRKTLKEEKQWLKETLNNIKKKKEVALLIETDNKVIGVSTVKLKEERHSHVGEFSISIAKDYRGKGLGKRLMKKILTLAKKELSPKLKIFRLSVYSKNKIAQKLYKQMGFKNVARVPKQVQYKRKLIDEIIMIREL